MSGKWRKRVKGTPKQIGRAFKSKSKGFDFGIGKDGDAKKFSKGDILEVTRETGFNVRKETSLYTSDPYTLNKGDRILITGEIGGDKYFKEFLPYSSKEFVARGFVPKYFVRYMHLAFEKVGRNKELTRGI